MISQSGLGHPNRNAACTVGLCSHSSEVGISSPDICRGMDGHRQMMELDQTLPPTIHLSLTLICIKEKNSPLVKRN